MSSEPFDADASIRPSTSPSNDSAAYASPYMASSAWIGDDQQREDREAAGLPVEPQLIVNFLGWLSIGVGLAQLVAPRFVGRAIGVGEQHTALIRSLGVREVTSGLGLLSGRAPSAWAWSRVGGDALDLALLGAAARTPGANPQRIAAAATAVLGVTALDVYASRHLGQIELEAPDEIIRESLAINSTPQALYTFWKNVENLPRFMGHLESVTATGERTSHWIARAPARMSVEWDAEIVRDDPDEGLSWQTVPGSEVTHEGTVRFEPARSGRGTIVRVEMRYRPPAGKVGVQIARLFGEEPQLQIRDDLRRLKQLIETGELATTFGQPSGRRSLIGRTTLGGRVQ
jgi:uncharacterized membrane protein